MNALFNFIQNSPSAFHAVSQAKKELLRKGFKELFEKEEFKLKLGGKYFVCRDDCALIAFVLPTKKEISAANILLSHTDSPTFKIKPKAEFEKEKMLFWGLEAYGSPVYSSWLNRDCGFAGRVFFEKDKKVSSELISIDEVPLIITQLPIHIDRKVNEQGPKICAQEHLNALVGILPNKKPEKLLETLLHKKIKFQKLLEHELFLFPLDPPRFIGNQKDLFSAPRIDNLTSVCASLEALLKTASQKNTHFLNIIYLASHEEVGSRTYSGANSPFFKCIFERIFYQLKLSFESMQRALAQSIALSIDGSHAMDPKSLKSFEPKHTPYLGEGVAIKVDASACYAYSSEIIAKIKALKGARKIKIQSFLKRGDARQGSTIGPIFTQTMGIKTLDLGIAQLSMHNAREVASCRDYEQLVKLLELVLKNQL